MFDYLKPSGRQMMSTNSNDEQTQNNVIGKVMENSKPAVEAGVNAVFGNQGGDGQQINTPDAGQPFGAPEVTPGVNTPDAGQPFGAPEVTPGNDDDFKMNESLIDAENAGGEIVGKPGEGEEDETGSIGDFYDLLEKANKYGDDYVEAYKKKHPRQEVSGEVDYSGMTPEEIEAYQKKEKRKRTWMGIVDALKDAANAFGVTQGVGASNWGQTYNASDDARKARIQQEVLASRQKYNADLEKKRDDVVKQYLSAYRDREKKAAEAEKQRKAEERQADADKRRAEQDKKNEQRRQEQDDRARKNAILEAKRKGYSAIHSGVRDREELKKQYGLTDKEIDDAIKDADKKANKSSESKSNTSYVVTDKDGKKHTYKGTHALNEAYLKACEVTGKKPKKNATTNEMLQEIEKTRKDMSVNDEPTPEPESMRDRYLAKRGKVEGDGSSESDWA